MRRARRVAGLVVGALAAGALTVAALRLGWLLQWPRALLAGLLVATAVAVLGPVALAQDLVGPGRWPDPPEPERVAGWPQLALVAGALRKTSALRKSEAVGKKGREQRRIGTDRGSDEG